MRAVVLVGGFGTRLRPLTEDIPKPLLPVGQRPIIEHVVRSLAAGGVTEVVLALGFRPDAFSAAYPDGTCDGVPLRYAVEQEPLDVVVREAGYGRRLEAREGLAVPLALAKDREPRQAGLGALEHDALEDRGVAANRDAPLVIVILLVEGVPRAKAADKVVRLRDHVASLPRTPDERRARGAVWGEPVRASGLWTRILATP